METIYLLNSCAYFQVTLSGFRSGKFSTLVATNVAARGLDIDDVQLIIQVFFSLYFSLELYLHIYYFLFLVIMLLSVLTF